MIKNKIRIGGFCLLAALASGCTDDRNASGGRNEGETALTFSMTRASASIVNNTQVYLFDGEGSASGQFRMKVPDVSYEADRLSMSIAAGTWNLALLSADTDINSRIISPVRGHDCASLKMWESASSGGSLSSMPELRTAFITGQPVVAGQETQASGTTLLSRNVALVKVVIADGGGLDVSGMHHFRLTDVPTTLNWKGGLYPSKDAPVVSPDAMTGSFVISNHPTQPGHQVSDTLRFIIPAHKGTDYLNPSPVDTTTHHLKLSVDLALDGGTRFMKNEVTIPRVPRVNGILLVRLTVGGKLDVSTEILDWVDAEVNADLSQTQLFTDKASVGLAHKDTLHINTNASDYTLDKAPDANWITLRKLDGNAVEVTADVNSYVDNSPRTSYITVTANNVTKKIPVTQRPDRGTIKASVDRLQFSPVHPTASLSVSSIGGGWKVVEQSPKAIASITQGVMGTASVSFSRTTTDDDDMYDYFYGDGQVVLKNTTTLDTDTVKLSNLYIGIVDNLIEVAQPIVHPDTMCTVDNVKVYGGVTRNLTIINKPSWIHPEPETHYNPAAGIFTFVCDREPNEEERYGEITLGHVDDPAYTVTVSVLQDIIVRIPEFHYFVVQFVWSANDVDVKVGFSGNPTSVIVNGITYNTSSVTAFQDRWVGWSQGTSVNYNSKELLRWGDDARQGQGETAFFNAPVINSAPYPGQHGVLPNEPGMLPRTVTLQVNAGWYSGGGIPMTCNIYAYLGGTMKQVGTNFINEGGALVYSSTNQFRVIASGIKVYDHICDIIYDRKKHTAKINWTGTLWSNTYSAVPALLQREEQVTISKPYWAPTVVHCYSDDYTGKRVK